MSREKLLINNPKSNNSEDMSNKQIEEMAKVLNECCNRYDEKGNLLGNKCGSCEHWCDTNHICCSYNTKEAEALYTAGYRKQSEGEWIAKERISTSKRGRTIHYATYKCSVCGKWNGRKKQKYCPDCGVKMKGGAE